MNTTFEIWLAAQFAEGLVDIKFAVLAGKGVSVEAIQQELLAAEASVAKFPGNPAPQPASTIPSEVVAMMGSVLAV